VARRIGEEAEHIAALRCPEADKRIRREYEQGAVPVGATSHFADRSIDANAYSAASSECRVVDFSRLRLMTSANPADCRGWTLGDDRGDKHDVPNDAIPWRLGGRLNRAKWHSPNDVCLWRSGSRSHVPSVACHNDVFLPALARATTLANSPRVASTSAIAVRVRRPAPS
jgi:hypothetical protein